MKHSGIVLLSSLLYLLVVGNVIAAPVNLALSGTASQSSTYNEAYPCSWCGPELAIDNNTYGIWVPGDGNGNTITHTNSEYEAWWQVDLGNTYNIEQIDIWNRTDIGVEDRLHDFTLSILDSGLNPVWSQLYDEIAGVHEIFGSMGTGILAAGQYVKVQFSGHAEYLSLAEVQVWGEPTPVPIPAAVWLFGSGLLGLIGFSRRKKAAA